MKLVAPFCRHSRSRTKDTCAIWSWPFLVVGKCSSRRGVFCASYYTSRPDERNKRVSRGTKAGRIPLKPNFARVTSYKRYKRFRVIADAFRRCAFTTLYARAYSRTSGAGLPLPLFGRFRPIDLAAANFSSRGKFRDRDAA